MKANVTVFIKSVIFYFLICRVFGSFSNQITWKVVTENLHYYFYHEKSQNFDFFQEKHFFCTFLSKIQQILDKNKKQKNPFLDMCLYVIFTKFGHF